MSDNGVRPEDGVGHEDEHGDAVRLGNRVSWVRTTALMGTVVGVHVISDRPLDDDPCVDSATRDTFATLRNIEDVFTPFQDDSDIRRIARGDLDVCDADPRVMEVLDLCLTARSRTRRLFDPWWKGWFDPTGIVKGWSVELAVRRHLAPLVESGRVEAVGVNAGGDMQLVTAPESTWTWKVGIADPFNPGATVGRVSLKSGAVATSGTAERGSHIVDPRTSRPAKSVASATVVAQGLTEADLWATVSCVSGFDDMSWVRDSHAESALVIGVDHQARRWVRQPADETLQGGEELSSLSAPPLDRRRAS